MKKFTKPVIFATMFVFCAAVTGCGCGKKKDPDEAAQKVMEITITPQPTPTPALAQINKDAITTNGNMVMVNEYLAGKKGKNNDNQ